MARNKRSQRGGAATSHLARFPFVLLAGAVVVLMLSAAACGGGAGSESEDTSPGAGITITTYRSPT